MPGQFILPLVLAVPLLGAIFVMCTPKTESSLHRGLGLTFSTIAFVISLFSLKFFNAKSDAFQLVFDVEWISGLGAHFKVGVDGMSIFLVILTTFLMPLTILGTRKAVEKHSREFMASMLVLETGMLGAFVALDLFLFYVSWEVMLIPMYLLIGIWTRSAAASFQLIVDTTDRDISHLMDALEALRKFYTLLYLLIMIAVIAFLVGLGMQLFLRFDA